ncbi:response regulator transcription factor [Povalibacter sp.]|uniref:response regulator transcription factor n=1 Tax=Povalibacter sp. TaxID=1962978 RepID=UPI002F3F9A38
MTKLVRCPKTGANVEVEVMSLDKTTLRVVVVDDHPVVRDGLASMLETQDDIEVVGQAANGASAVAAYTALRPDVMVLDLQMPRMDGFEAATRIIASDPAAQILIMTTYVGDEDIFRCLRLGAKGYIVKDVPFEEILTAIRVVGGGGEYTSPQVAAKALRRSAQTGLTQRECDVLALLVEGRSNKDIARRLNLGEESVKSHVKAILAKLDAISRTEAVTIAMRRGLVHL